jgi:hypothetical protein
MEDMLDAVPAKLLKARIFTLYVVYRVKDEIVNGDEVPEASCQVDPLSVEY